MKVLKFGGTSVATPDNVRRVIEIVRRATEGGPVVVVVSAFGGVTNDLVAAAEAAARRADGYRKIYNAIRQRHLDAAHELAASEADALVGRLEESLDDLGDLLHGVYLLRECSPRTRDGILSYGERLSAEVVAAALHAAAVAAEACDARRLIVTDDAFGRAQVELDASFARIREHFEQPRALAVVTGFIAATAEGRTTTLGRGGSDYTAALLGAAFAAEAIELWTDVDGVMSADPRLVAEAFPQPELSYAELMELSHFGAKVVYPPTIHPARGAGIPILIKNTFRPEAPGTRVAETLVAEEGREGAPRFPIRGISSVNQVALMRLEGDGMVGVPGIAMRLFGALARRQVSVILISQASSEHSICFAVAPEDAGRARAAVDEEFALEKRLGIIDELVAEEDQSVIAAVGERMRHRPGISGSLFGVLGEHGINVRAIAQGSSELNISLVVDRGDEERALNAIHGAFFHPGRRRVAVALAGPGRVGAALLEQLREAAARLLADERLDLRLVAVADSRRLLLDGDGVDLDRWQPRLEAAPALASEELLDFLGGLAGDLRIFVDCTASSEVAGWYPALLAERVAVVAANKLAFAGPLKVFDRLRRESRRHGAPLLFEATAGAGLPVLSTLADLVRTGHPPERIGGVLSGTANAVLDRLAAGEPFSAAVRRAHAEGLTEPHPYEDLSGADVARKLLILGRLAGHPLEPEAVAVEPLLPGDPWASLDLDAFWKALPEVDAEFERRRRQAAGEGARLRYVASLAGSRARVALSAVPPEHPAYGLAGPDNLVAFTSRHYRDRPLVVRGPGAGPAVTASGVFADLLRAVTLLNDSAPESTNALSDDIVALERETFPRKESLDAPIDRLVLLP